MKNLAEIRIDLSAIEHNLNWIQEKVGTEREVMPMIKADAYGHGAVALARLYVKQGIREFGVALLSEAIALREAGITENIVVFQPGFLIHPQAYVDHQLEAVLNSPGDIDCLTGLSKVNCHLMVDTGMGREGMMPADVSACLEKLDQYPDLRLKGVCTHFACSDERNPNSTRRQISLFEDVLQSLPSQTRSDVIVHAANSGAIVNFPKAHYDRVRPGILLYGVYAGAGCVDQKPAMSVHALLAHKKQVPPGFSIGYGATFVTETTTELGVFSFGYADAFLRIHSNRASLWYGGKAFPVLGRISMDQVVVDLKGRTDIEIGAEFTVFSGNFGDESSLFTEAHRLSTITYERTCQLGMMRLPRVFICNYSAF